MTMEKMRTQQKCGKKNQTKPPSL